MIEESILVISSYDKTEDHLFHSKKLGRCLTSQGRKVLIHWRHRTIRGKFVQKGIICDFHIQNVPK
jgi:hypothetical protein